MTVETGSRAAYRIFRAVSAPSSDGIALVSSRLESKNLPARRTGADQGSAQERLSGARTAVQPLAARPRADGGAARARGALA